jgi:hypothetical protein
MKPNVSAGPLGEALRLMAQALDILDRENAPADIGAHLDMAIQRLRHGLSAPEPGEGAPS